MTASRIILIPKVGAGSSGGASALDDLTDVTITAAASGDILRHNGTAWVDAVGTTHFEAAGAVAAHEADTTNVHGIADTSVLETTTGSASKVSTHAAAADPHGDRAYTDAQIAAMLTSAFDFKASVKAATTANITLSGAQTIDGVSVIAGDRVLVKDQSTGSQNGVYVAAAGAWSRSTDADVSAEVTAGLAVPVEQGTANGGRLFMLTTTGSITLGTTALTFTRIDAGTLVASNNLSDLTNAATARTNLGLAIGTNVQAFDQDLADIAGVTRTKGDLIVASSSAWTDLAVGTDGHVLTADSAQATGVKWAAAAGGSSQTFSRVSMVSGTNHYSIPGVTFTSTYTSAALAANTVYFASWYCPSSITFDQIATYCAVGVASGKVRIGVYNATADGIPTTLVVESGELDTSAVGVKAGTVSSTTIAAGMYCFAVASNSGTHQLIALISPSTHMRASTGYDAVRESTASFTYGALPSTATAPTSLIYADGTRRFMSYLRLTS